MNRKGQPWRLRLPPLFFLTTVIAGLATASAQRDPVLKQIDLPHAYYYREMYLPQLTTGPSSVSWSPDGTEVVYSMAGSLWRQRLDSDVAEQLTSGPGYDYQPDWSPDGRRIVYAKYDRDAIELWLLDLQTGNHAALTWGGSVNVEPRWSPDGKRIVFVSTQYNRRFHIFLLQVEEGEPRALERLTGETESPLPRYYYSRYDHEISPAWSPDGSEIIFVSNRGHIYGTGGFWRMKAQPGGEAREIHYEETTWKARPDWSPDGKRLLYSSYLGRQWHQLWVTTPDGGDPFPLSYGEFENTAARWSPDGTRIAFISNRAGNPSLWIQDVVGGRQWPLVIRQRRYRQRMATIRLAIRDSEGRATPARVAITGEDGRAYAPDSVWIHADEAFVRAQRNFEPHYFHLQADSEIAVPSGKVVVEVTKGPEHRIARRQLDLLPRQSVSLSVGLEPLLPLPSAGGRWASGDLHVHMNYGGAYRNTPQHLVEQAEAENLQVVHNLIVNKEQRIPDIAYFLTQPDAASTPETLVLHGQEFHTSFWGHMGLLHLSDHFLLPDYAAYPNTAAASLFPTNSAIADLAHSQGALVGYVHPYDEGFGPDPGSSSALTHALVVDVALGKMDYLEVLGFSDHHTTAAVWYRFLNLGFRIPAGAGTDAMANFASQRGPVGLTRVYVRVPDGPLKIGPWLEGLRQGRTFATNAPLLDFTLGGQAIGGELTLPGGGREVPFTASLRSAVPMEHLEVVCNGQVVRELSLGARRDYAEVRGTVPLTQSGWCLLRAFTSKHTYPVLDLYPYGTTSPIYVTVDGQEPRSPADAEFCIAWIDRIRESVDKHTGWNTPAERAAVLRMLATARAVYEQKTR